MCSKRTKSPLRTRTGFSKESTSASAGFILHKLLSSLWLYVVTCGRRDRHHKNHIAILIVHRIKSFLPSRKLRVTGTNLLPQPTSSIDRLDFLSNDATRSGTNALSKLMTTVTIHKEPTRCRTAHFPSCSMNQNPYIASHTFRSMITSHNYKILGNIFRIKHWSNVTT